jgi:hypothetical protein
MGDRVSIRALRERASSGYVFDIEGFRCGDVLALVEAVEAAENLRRRMGMGTASALAELEDALARFDFGEDWTPFEAPKVEPVERGLFEQAIQAIKREMARSLAKRDRA